MKIYWSEFSRGNSNFLSFTALHNAMNLKFWPMWPFYKWRSLYDVNFQLSWPMKYYFWPVKSSKVTWHSNWRRELSSFIKVHLRWKVRVAHVKSVRIWNFSSQYFPASVWILRFTEQISIFSLNAGKYEQEKLRIRTLLYSA